MINRINIKKVAIVLLVAYLILSPIIIIHAANKAYHKGQWDGIYIALKNDEETHNSESPQQHFKIGDIVSTTDEFWQWKGDTTSFTGWIINTEETGNVTVKIKQGTCRCNMNNYTLNEYWLEKIGHDEPEKYTGWYWK